MTKALRHPPAARAFALTIGLTGSLAAATTLGIARTGHAQTPAAAPAQPARQAAQTHDHPAETRPATLVSGLGNVRHVIDTRVPDAQRFFDQGLAFVYAFNHDEAVRSFSRAAELDPRSPMPHWGVALALGANINREIDAERSRLAYEAIQRAQRLASRAPEAERAYVNALARRYSADPNADPKQLAAQYAEAMAALVKVYPNDLDAATLYAESLMNLRPWQLWATDGTPEEGTLTIVETLETALRKNPNHLGANHYYIHATEASLSPDRALESAKKLETLAPAAGHLVHMPAHVYMRTGNYAAAVTANARGAEADRKYIAESSASGFYPTMYYNHNLDFLASAAMMSGQFAEAMKAADEVVANVTPALADMAMLEPFAAKKHLVLLRFGRWTDVLQLPAPPSTAPILTTLHHFSRGVAHAALGAVAEAEREQVLYAEARRAIPADAPWLFNTSERMLAVCDAVLEARLAAARGETEAALAAWRKAVAAEDLLNYDEPPDWYYPTRESLGAALLKVRRLDDAERVFREDLERNPNNPRSLFGLWQTMRVTDARGAATLVMGRRFLQAWRDADVELSLADF